jgi:uncharacterized protein (DUF2147 family)
LWDRFKDRLFTMLKYVAIILLLFPALSLDADTVPKSDIICGKWLAAEKNLIVEVYKSGGMFKGKIVWFADEPGEPMAGWTDKHNPDPKLRDRKILGLDVLRDLKYDAGDNSWEDGLIYDAKHGKEWNAAVYIDKNGVMKVKGYWHLKIFGRTMVFTRFDSSVPKKGTAVFTAAPSI